MGGNEMIAVVGGCAILGFFAYAIVAIIVGIFRHEPPYEKRQVAQPMCGPSCGDYNFTGWSVEQVQAYNENHATPEPVRGVLPEQARVELPAGRHVRGLPSPSVVEGRLHDAPSKALPEGTRSIPLQVPNRERNRVRR